MKAIPLTQGKSAIVDDADYEWLSQWKWYYAEGYARRNIRLDNGNRSMVQMHQLLIKTSEGMEIDHKNGNSLDNQRRNLRVCSHAQNTRNKKTRTDCVSGLKGAFYHKRFKKFQSAIMLNGVSKHLGYFPTAELAHVAYRAAAEKLHGEFARAA